MVAMQGSHLLLRWKLKNTGVATRKPPLLGSSDEEQKLAVKDSNVEVTALRRLESKNL